ncbi:adhesion G-protein coupled receptor G6-like isoform X2 [Tubulanus polymorphus]|uniref:adhesion G-protein coupled receptor G6-like isoform X2 n=1 Tax=Tubulanus polymorphus TaxID=672921 RepID=UPI003DA26BBD
MHLLGLIPLMSLLMLSEIDKISSGRKSCPPKLPQICKCTNTGIGLEVNCERIGDSSPIVSDDLRKLKLPRQTTKLILRNNNIDRLFKDFFTNLSLLQTLDLSANNIYSIEDGTFSSNMLLNTIDLSGNRLKCDCDTLSFRSWAKMMMKLSVVGANCTTESNQIKDIFTLPIADFGKCNAVTTPRWPEFTVKPPGTDGVKHTQCFKCLSKSRIADCLAVNSKEICTTSQTCSSSVLLHPATKRITMSKGCLEKKDCKSKKCVTTNSKKLIQKHTCSDCCVGDLCNDADPLKRFLKSVDFSVQINTSLVKVCENASNDLERWMHEALNGRAFVLEGIEFHCNPADKRQSTKFNISARVFDEATRNEIKNQIIALIKAHRFLNEIIGEINFSMSGEVVCLPDVTVDKFRGTIHWSRALPGDTQYRPCPFQKDTAVQDGDPMAWRKCALKGKKIEWTKPNLGRCGFENPKSNKLATLSETIVNKDNVDSVLNDLGNLTSNSKTLTSADIALTSKTVDKIFGVPEAFEKTSQNETAYSLVSIFANLIGANATSLEVAQNESKGTNKIIEQIDELADIVVIEGNDVLSITDVNMALKVVSSQSIGIGGFLYQGQNGGSNIAIPKSVFSNNTKAEKVKVLGKLSENEFPLNSEVLSISIGLQEKKGLDQPITLTFNNAKVTTNQQMCVFWDFMANGGKGNWSTEGCLTTATVSGITSCECNHLTNFALLMNVHGGAGTITTSEHRRILSIISILGCSLSLLALFATLLTYLLFEKLRKDIPSQLLICLCIALFCVNAVFVFGSHVQTDDIPCKVVGILLHYFLLSSFTWMLVEAFYMYLALVKVFQPYFSRLLLKFSLVGWGVPLVIVGVTIGVDTNYYGPQGDPQNPFCWLSRIAFYGSFLGPVCVVLLLNIVSFILVVKQIYSMGKRSKISRREKSSISTQLKGAIGVMLLLGLTWVFGLFAISGVSALVFSYVFVILNTLQGLFIFVFYCVMKRDAQKAWARKCGYTDIVDSSTSSSKGIYNMTRAAQRNGCSCYPVKCNKNRLLCYTRVSSWASTSSSGTISSRLSAVSRKSKGTSSIGNDNLSVKKRPNQENCISAEGPAKSSVAMVPIDSTENTKNNECYSVNPEDIQLDYDTKL